MGLVLDTSALIALERSDAVGLDLGSEPGVVPAIVLAELHVGVLMADSPAQAAARRAKVDALIGRLPVIDFDAAIAERWALLFTVLTRDGVAIPSNDLAVAATAQHLDFGVIIGPRGEKHFERIPGLRVERLTT